jgi:beta-1,4-glucosyltransferase
LAGEARWTESASAASADGMARLLAECAGELRVTTVTWLNHYSAQKVLQTEPASLEHFSYVGVDGMLLLALTKARHRTSADLVVPRLIASLEGARVLLIGGTEAAISGASDAIERLLQPSSLVVGSYDGYENLPTGDPLKALIESATPTLVLVGLGGGLQEQVALEIARIMPKGLVLTCGGFLDQIQRPGYYPDWAYRTRLNWAVRLSREPRRLWRRYTIDALAALCKRKTLRSATMGAPGFQRLEKQLDMRTHDKANTTGSIT